MRAPATWSAPALPPARQPRPTPSASAHNATVVPSRPVLTSLVDVSGRAPQEMKVRGVRACVRLVDSDDVTPLVVIPRVKVDSSPMSRLKEFICTNEELKSRSAAAAGPRWRAVTLELVLEFLAEPEIIQL